jgi:hypothetical protein
MRAVKALVQPCKSATTTLQTSEVSMVRMRIICLLSSSWHVAVASPPCTVDQIFQGAPGRSGIWQPSHRLWTNACLPHFIVHHARHKKKHTGKSIHSSMHRLLGAWCWGSVDVPSSVAKYEQTHHPTQAFCRRQNVTSSCVPSERLAA